MVQALINLILPPPGKKKQCSGLGILDGFFKNAAKEFIQIICQNIYTNENVNVKDSLNETIIDQINKSLDNPKTGEELRRIVFGNDCQTGLRRYIQHLFTFSMKTKNANVYPFMYRVLKIFIHKEDTIIPEILGEALVKLYTEVNELPILEDKFYKILLFMEEIIYDKLQKTDFQDEDSSTDKIVTINDVKSKSSNLSSSINKNSTNNDKLKGFKIIEKKPSKTTSIVVSAANNSLLLTGKAESINKQFVDAMSDASYGEDEIPFNAKIQEQILKAIDSMFDKMKNNIYERIAEIVDKYTKFLLNEKQIKLQILYSILSYKNDELEKEVQEQTETEKEKEDKNKIEEKKEKESMIMFNSVNNTFFIIHKIFEESIKNFMNNEFNKNENLKKIQNDKNFIKILCVGDNGKSSGILFHLNKIHFYIALIQLIEKDYLLYIHIYICH